jgi:carbamoyl-phosphate synthase small subunit
MTEVVSLFYFCKNLKMKKHTATEAILLLEDGTIYKGKSLGRIGTSGGELCFNTGMTGYQEIFTDPSYYGQVVVNTVSHVGNYGVQHQEVESDRVQISALVCKDFSHHYSRKTAEGSLQEYFEKAGIVGICEIDTRALVRHIRDKGAMNAIVSSEITDIDELRKRLAEVPSMAGLELSSRVSTPETYDLKPEDVKFRVAVLDLGVKRNSLHNFMQRGCEVKVFPYNTPFEEMEKWNPDGYFISNGPGDPAATKDAVDSVKQILAKSKPMFGICMGHQILAQANGIATYKMHNGHRGLNHPVKNLITGRSEITSQNHGFVVDAEQVRNHPDVEVTHINLNDNTIEGMRMKTKPAFSVQYHPESSPGPHDSEYLFDDFVTLLEQSKNQVKL